MKNWKHYGIIGFLLILFLTFIFIACEDDKKKCNCIEKTHLDVGESCNCGGENCNCTLKINATLNAGIITVWKEVGVSIVEFNEMVDELNILVSTQALTPTQINNFKNNFPEIRIKQGTGVSHQGTVLSIGCNEIGHNIYNYLVTDNNLL